MLVVLAAAMSIGATIPLAFVAIAAGLSNVMMILTRPNIEASDDEIRFASTVGPFWFARLIAKLELQP